MSRIASLMMCVLTVAQVAAAAQKVPTTFRDLSLLVKPGAFVTLIDRAGEELKGRVTALSDTEIVLSTSRGERRLLQMDVVLIQQRRSDSVLDGTLIGAAIGGGIGLLMEASCGPRSICAEAPNGQMFIGGLVWGTGIGLLSDALRKSSQPVFRSGDGAQLTVNIAPIVGRRRTGAAIALTW